MASERQVAYCRAYARIDGDDMMVRQLCDAAIGYLTTAGCARGIDGTPRAAQYDLCMAALVLHYYDHRDSVGTEAAIPIGAQNIINQLKLSAEAPSM